MPAGLLPGSQLAPSWCVFTGVREGVRELCGLSSKVALFLVTKLLNHIPKVLPLDTIIFGG